MNNLDFMEKNLRTELLKMGFRPLQATLGTEAGMNHYRCSAKFQGGAWKSCLDRAKTAAGGAAVLKRNKAEDKAKRGKAQ